MTAPAAAVDTIVAIATAPGRGGIGAVRLSGFAARLIAETICGRALKPRRAHHVRFTDVDGRVIDDGIAIYFRAPASFTGEDVVELHAHGSPIVLAELVARCVALGARHARAGEFSERAFVNERLDLAQAEAIADLIAAQSQAQARAARRSLDGEFSQRVDALLAQLIRLRVYVEAAIDFPEEEIDFLGDGRVAADLAAVIATTGELLGIARRGQRLRDGLHAVILGPPNAGKSSLLNALAGSDRAIVTEIAGTTRDLLRETGVVDGVELTLVDTAGLRETDDAIEAEGMRRARAERDHADLALLVVDARDVVPLAALLDECAGVPRRIVVHNKIDLVPTSSKQALVARAGYPDDVHVLLSARDGDGVALLRDALRTIAEGDDGADGALSARARHVAALERVASHLARGEEELRERRAGELLAEELQLAQRALSSITGAFGADALLGEIFSSFCIGK